MHWVLRHLLCVKSFHLVHKGDIGIKSSLYKQRKHPRKIFPLLTKASYPHNMPKYAEPIGSYMMYQTKCDIFACMQYTLMFLS